MLFGHSKPSFSTYLVKVIGNPNKTSQNTQRTKTSQIPSRLPDNWTIQTQFLGISSLKSPFWNYLWNEFQTTQNVRLHQLFFTIHVIIIVFALCIHLLLFKFYIYSTWLESKFFGIVLLISHILTQVRFFYIFIVLKVTYFLSLQFLFQCDIYQILHLNQFVFLLFWLLHLILSIFFFSVWLVDELL